MYVYKVFGFLCFFLMSCSEKEIPGTSHRAQVLDVIRETRRAVDPQRGKDQIQSVRFRSHLWNEHTGDLLEDLVIRIPGDVYQKIDQGNQAQTIISTPQKTVTILDDGPKPLNPKVRTYLLNKIRLSCLRLFPEQELETYEVISETKQKITLSNMVQGQGYRITINKSTFLPEKVALYEGPNHMIKQVYYRDFQTLQGMVFPKVMHYAMENGMVVATRDITEIELNPEAANALFSAATNNSP